MPISEAVAALLNGETTVDIVIDGSAVPPAQGRAQLSEETAEAASETPGERKRVWTTPANVALGLIDDIADPGSRGYVLQIGEAFFHGFVVRKGGEVAGWSTAARIRVSRSPSSWTLSDPGRIPDPVRLARGGVRADHRKMRRRPLRGRKTLALAGQGRGRDAAHGLKVLPRGEDLALLVAAEGLVDLVFLDALGRIARLAEVLFLGAVAHHPGVRIGILRVGHGRHPVWRRLDNAAPTPPFRGEDGYFFNRLALATAVSWIGFSASAWAFRSSVFRVSI
jgi:hypothetical protein